MWSRLTENTEGATTWGPQRISNNIANFLNGHGPQLANVLFTPNEQQRIREYGALMRQLTPLPGTVNYSNTAPMLRMIAANSFRAISLNGKAYPTGRGASSASGRKRPVSGFRRLTPYLGPERGLRVKKVPVNTGFLAGVFAKGSGHMKRIVLDGTTAGTSSAHG